MSRPPKLSAEIKEEIRRKLLAGERPVDLAPEYGVTIKTISRMKREAQYPENGHMRVPVDDIKAAAAKSLQNDLADPIVRPLLEAMGDQDRSLFYSHKADLMEITLQLSMASKYSAQNAHKLSRMAQAQLSKINEDAPTEDGGRDLLNNAMMYQAGANECAKTPMKLFEIATKQPPPQPEDKPIRIIGGMNTEPVAYDYPSPNRKSDDDI